MISPELCHIIDFFELVDYEVSNVMNESPNVFEDNLTFILGKMLDSKSSLHKVLPYPITKLKENLNDLGSDLNFKFTTHEHNSRNLEGVTFADLGIVVKINKPGLSVEKGVLVQCKRLYPNNNKFSLESEYDGFDKDQFIDIQKEVKNKLQYRYLFYNPTLKSFDEEHDILDYEWNSKSSDYDLYTFLNHYYGKPGIKVASAEFIENLGKFNFSLEECYKLSTIHKGKDFKAFSSFILDLLTCKLRIKDKKLQKKQLQLCKGKKPNDEDYFNKGIIAKSTIEIEYTSKNE